MENDLTRRLETALGELEAERKKSEAYCAEKALLAGRLAEKSGELELVRAELDSVRGQLAETRAELDQRKDVETQIREFDAKLSKIEDLKREYEKKIDELQTRLRDALGRDINTVFSDLLDPDADIVPIDMRMRPRDVRIINPVAKPVLPEPKEPERKDGLLTKENADLPRRDEGTPNNPTDWLMDLPEDF